MTPLTWTEPDHMLPFASCASNLRQLQNNEITQIMRMLWTS